MLANDGTIRWLGDPIAKLVAGEETLKPRAVILADDALSAEGREAVQQRVALWLVAHVRKALGPLLSLAEPESVPEGVRDLALKLSQSLGVLERERVKAQVKALDQNARGALRKIGVRFGAFYIYVPALLKPASRTLCTQLWALLRADADKEAVAERLLHFASSGRTSFAVEPPASGEVYRVAGFRLCGDRAVRVDIVERLTDLIRAALPRHDAVRRARADGGRRRGICRHQSDDVFDGLFGRAFRLDSAFSRFRQPQGEEVGVSRRGAQSRRRGGERRRGAARPPPQNEESGQPETATDAAPTTSAEDIRACACRRGRRIGAERKRTATAEGSAPRRRRRERGRAACPPRLEAGDARGGRRPRRPPRKKSPAKTN